MENQTKEVRYDLYCNTCRFKEKSEADDICHECLENPSNIDSHKPVNWKEK